MQFTGVDRICSKPNVLPIPLFNIQENLVRGEHLSGIDVFNERLLVRRGSCGIKLLVMALVNPQNLIGNIDNLKLWAVERVPRTAAKGKNSVQIPHGLGQMHPPVERCEIVHERLFSSLSREYVHGLNQVRNCLSGAVDVVTSQGPQAPHDVSNFLSRWSRGAVCLFVASPHAILKTNRKLCAIPMGFQKDDPMVAHAKFPGLHVERLRQSPNGELGTSMPHNLQGANGGPE